VWGHRVSARYSPAVLQIIPVKIDEINDNQFNWNSVFHLRSEDGRCSMLKRPKTVQRRISGK
jgi:hypothetical protein